MSGAKDRETYSAALIPRTHYFVVQTCPKLKITEPQTGSHKPSGALKLVR